MRESSESLLEMGKEIRGATDLQARHNSEVASSVQDLQRVYNF